MIYQFAGQQTPQGMVQASTVGSQNVSLGGSQVILTHHPQQMGHPQQHHPQQFTMMQAQQQAQQQQPVRPPNVMPAQQVQVVQQCELLFTVSDFYNFRLEK